MTRAMSAQRDQAIDTVRGICIVTMVAAHLARYTWANDWTHPLPWVDGAAGFVLISGLLIGIVQRSTIDRGGFRSGAVKQLRRVRLVYIAHVLLSMTALTVGSLLEAGSTLPEASDEGGWSTALVHALTLQINPNDASVLSLYVVVMLASLPVVWLLSRGRPRPAVALAGAVYLAGIAAPGWSRLPSESGEPGSWAYAAWFGLFVAGLFAGWWWRSPQVQVFAIGRRTLEVGVAVLAIGLAISVVLSRTNIGLRILDKEVFGPGRLLLSVIAFFVIWRACRWALRGRAAARLLHPLTVVGTRSLDSYVLLTLVVLTAPVVLGREHDFAGPVAAGLTLLSCVTWAYLRRLVKPGRSALRAAATDV